MKQSWENDDCADVTELQAEEGEELPPLPRNMRTPITDAGEVVAQLASLWDDLISQVEALNGKNFIEVFFGPMFQRDDTSGDKEVDDLFKNLEENPEETTKFAILQAMVISCAYAVQAMKAAGTPAGVHTPEAWQYAADARRWEGIATGSWSIRSESPLSVESLARKGAEARHVKNREYKQRAIAAYRDGKFPSKDAAAAKIAGTVVPLSFRAVREYLKGI